MSDYISEGGGVLVRFPPEVPVKESSKFEDPYPQSKQDRERAEAVIETISRGFLDWYGPSQSIPHPEIRHHLGTFTDFLMEVFRAARGDA